MTVYSIYIIKNEFKEPFLWHNSYTRVFKQCSGKTAIWLNFQ